MFSRPSAITYESDDVLGEDLSTAQIPSALVRALMSEDEATTRIPKGVLASMLLQHGIREERPLASLASMVVPAPPKRPGARSRPRLPSQRDETDEHLRSLLGSLLDIANSESGGDGCDLLGDGYLNES
jgi:hypothetical protein